MLRSAWWVSAAFLGVSFAPATPTAGLEFQLPIRVVPADRWVEIYFDGIDDLSRRMGLKPLRSMSLRADDLELRVWTGFGITGERGFTSAPRALLRRRCDRTDRQGSPDAAVRAQSKAIGPR